MATLPLYSTRMPGSDMLIFFSIVSDVICDDDLDACSGLPDTLLVYARALELRVADVRSVNRAEAH